MTRQEVIISKNLEQSLAAAIEKCPWICYCAVMLRLCCVLIQKYRMQNCKKACWI